MSQIFSPTPHQRALLELPIEQRLFVEGPAGAGKTTAALLRMQQMLGSGVPGSQLMVLAPQRTLLAAYDRALRQPESLPGGVPTLLTVGGLAQRMVNLFWPLVAQECGFSRPDDPPVFLTLETAQYYMAHLVRPLLDEQRLFDSVVLERNRLFSQILDNLNKAALVGFSYQEIAERLKSAWIGEPGQLRVYDDVQTCATLFRQFCLQHNLLDFSLQIEVFCSAVWELPECRHYLGHSFSHLIFDNIEEDMPVAHDLLRHWLGDCVSSLLVFDRDAGYRSFLGADPSSAYQLQELCDLTLEFPESLVASPAIQSFNLFLATALQGLPIPPADSRAQPQMPEIHIESADLAESDVPAQPSAIINPKSKIINLKSTRFYPQMLDWVSRTIAGLVHDQGLPAGEIVVLAPFLSDALRFSLIDRLQQQGVAARSHRPSRSLRDEPATQCLLTLAALAYPQWGVCPSRFDVAYALVQSIQNLDLVRAQLLTEIVYRPKGNTPILTTFDQLRPELRARITYRLGESFEKLRLWLGAAREPDDELDHFLSRLFGELLSQPGFGFHNNYDAGQVAARLIESVQKFRWVAGAALSEQNTPLGQEYLAMVQAGVIAAQYLGGWRLEAENAVLLAPAYTFLMANRPVEVQFWLDVGSRAWSERLNQPLTHPYVLSRSWQAGRPWTDADELAAGRAAMLRLEVGLLRRCRSALYLGLSDLNEQGYEQRGPLLLALQRLIRRSAEL